MNVRISPFSLVLGALFTLGLFLVMGQAGPTSFGSWGPPKKAIVNIFEPSVASPMIPPNGHLLVYQVPSDRWLTVTSVFASTNNQDSARWSEVSGGVVSDKGLAFTFEPTSQDAHSLAVSPASAGGAIGWTFRPGSEVVISNVSGGPLTVSRYALIGYESRD